MLERVERERGRGVEQSSRKRWREEIRSVQFSGTPYGEGGALHTSAHSLSRGRRGGEGDTCPVTGILVRRGFWSGWTRMCPDKTVRPRDFGPGTEVFV